MLAAPHVDRIEVCSELATEGWTPSVELLRAVVGVARDTEARVFALIRSKPPVPGTGGEIADFVLDETALERSLDAVDAAASSGADGVAIGPLLTDGCIDHVASEALVSRASAHGLESSFLRSFDLVPDHHDALDLLTMLGVTRVLTTGAGCWDHSARSAEQRVETLERDVETARKLGAEAGRAPVEVMVCGGVRTRNVRDFLPVTRHVHGSCRSNGVFDEGELHSLAGMVRRP